MKVDGANRRNRILAVDVRPRWLGFAVFDASTQLLDFGLMRARSPKIRELRFVRLIRMFLPRLILIHVRRKQQSRIVRSLARVPNLSHGFPIVMERVSADKIRQHFRALGANNKDEVASLLARRFPQLSWKVPPPRKRWQHEHQNMPIFDAIGICLAHLEHNKNSLR